MQQRRIGGAGGGSDPAPKKAGPLVAAAVLAGSVAVAGGGIGAGGASLGGSSSVSSSAGNVFKARKAHSKKAARKGKAGQSWRRLGLRRLERATDGSPSCVGHSFGDVRELFVHTPCRSLDRALFGVSDGSGNIAAVSVVRVTMATHGQTRRFLDVIDVHGSGDIRPPAGPLLRSYGVRFTGLNYDSRRSGRTAVVAESETASGHFSDEELDTVAEIAALLAAHGAPG